MDSLKKKLINRYVEKQKAVKEMLYTDEKCVICWGTGSQYNDGRKCWNCDGVGYEPDVCAHLKGRKLSENEIKEVVEKVVENSKNIPPAFKIK